jgi:SPP1 gp7 family putative phage head morphogenesis protein
MTDTEVQLKGIIDDIVKKLAKLLDLSSLFHASRAHIRQEFRAGLEEAEVKLNMNFTPDENAIKFLEDYTFQNIKGMNDDISEKLRKELSQGLLNLESTSDLKKRVEFVMDVAEERAKMIARTESMRARNMGSLEGAKQSRLKLVKEWDASNDPCPTCKALHGKRIALDAKFDYKGEQFLSPPAHPNCRCSLRYIQR